MMGRVTQEGRGRGRHTLAKRTFITKNSENGVLVLNSESGQKERGRSSSQNEPWLCAVALDQFSGKEGQAPDILRYSIHPSYGRP